MNILLEFIGMVILVVSSGVMFWILFWITHQIAEHISTYLDKDLEDKDEE